MYNVGSQGLISVSLHTDMHLWFTMHTSDNDVVKTAELQWK